MSINELRARVLYKRIKPHIPLRIQSLRRLSTSSWRRPSTRPAATRPRQTATTCSSSAADPMKNFKGRNRSKTCTYIISLYKYKFSHRAVGKNDLNLEIKQTNREKETIIRMDRRRGKLDAEDSTSNKQRVTRTARGDRLARTEVEENTKYRTRAANAIVTIRSCCTCPSHTATGPEPQCVHHRNSKITVAP